MKRCATFWIAIGASWRGHNEAGIQVIPMILSGKRDAGFCPRKKAVRQPACARCDGTAKWFWGRPKGRNSTNGAVAFPNRQSALSRKSVPTLRRAKGPKRSDPGQATRLFSDVRSSAPRLEAVTRRDHLISKSDSARQIPVGLLDFCGEPVHLHVRPVTPPWNPTAIIRNGFPLPVE
jgi:hypothetical protein